MASAGDIHAFPFTNSVVSRLLKDYARTTDTEASAHIGEIAPDAGGVELVLLLGNRGRIELFMGDLEDDELASHAVDEAYEMLIYDRGALWPTCPHGDHPLSIEWRDREPNWVCKEHRVRILLGELGAAQG